MSLYAKKTLGQHFLKSDKAIREIVQAGNVTSADIVLEIGPGEGVLTEALLQTGATVFAVEMDDRCIPVLTERFSPYIAQKKFILLHGDVRDGNLLSLLFSPSHIGGTPYKLIANIPYYITGLLFRMFLETQPPVQQPTCMVYLIQKEVAEELVGRKGKLGNLSLAALLYGTPKLISKVPKGAFLPPPKVDSAIIAITNISKQHVQGFTETEYFAVVHAGLAKKRKQLFGNLREHFRIPQEHLESIFTELNIEKSIRGEDLPFPSWISLVQALSKQKLITT